MILLIILQKNQISILAQVPFRISTKNFQFRNKNKIINAHKGIMAQVWINANHAIFPVLNAMV